MVKDYSTFNLFTKALYDPKTLTIPLLLERYESLLKESQTFAHLMHSNRIHQYWKEIMILGISEIRKCPFFNN